MKREHLGKWHLNLLIGFLVLIIPILSQGPSPAAAAERDYLVVQTWGGTATEAFTKAFFEPFTKETGIKVKAIVAGSDVGAKLMAMNRTGNIEWDIATGSWTPFCESLYNKGLLEEIDYGIVTDVKDLYPGSARKWGVALFLESICLVYNTKAFPQDKAPTSWKDYFDIKTFPGPRSIANWGEPYDMLLIAEMADGVSPEKGFPIDFDRAFKMLDKAKPAIKVWYTSGEQLMQPLIDESVVMAISTDGRAKQAKSLGAPLEIVWNQAFFHYTWNVVVKGTPLKEEAMKLINFMCRPDRQAVFNKIRFMATTNLKTLDLLEPEIRKDQSTHPDNKVKIFSIIDLPNADWALEHLPEIEEKWNYWIAK